jgi:hypothetical protein
VTTGTGSNAQDATYSYRALQRPTRQARHLQPTTAQMESVFHLFDHASCPDAGWGDNCIGLAIPPHTLLSSTLCPAASLRLTTDSPREGIQVKIKPCSLEDSCQSKGKLPSFLPI